MEAVLISGSPSSASKSRTLLERAQRQLESAGWRTTVIDLASLSADGLLGRGDDQDIRNAIEAAVAAQIIVASSPTYRATYTGLLKTFFDLLPQDCWKGKIGLPLLTGGGPWHQLALDHGFRPLFASLGATTLNGVYGYDAQFKNGPDASLLAQVDDLIEEAVAMMTKSDLVLHSPSPVERGVGDEVKGTGVRGGVKGERRSG